MEDLDIEKQFMAGQTAFHHALNRVVKPAEREIPPANPSKSVDVVELPSSRMYPLIAQHLLRSGQIEMAKKIFPSLCAEQVEPYERLKRLVTSLRAREIGPVLDWVSTEPEGLEGSVLLELTFNLRKLHYGNLIKSRMSEEALEYARQHFLPYASVHHEEMRKLLGALAFLPSIEDPAYRSIVGSTVLMRTEELLAKAFCRSMKLPTEAHLLTLVRASAHAIPCLSKYEQLSSSLSASQPSAKLSLEIPLPKEFTFHSLFCCPVSKELSNPHNPPQLLPCGHALSKDIITELARGRASYRSAAPGAHPEVTHPFKCPYCPEKVLASQVKTLNFD
jgi:hypothetical protein